MKFRALFGRQKTAGKPVAPVIAVEHEHDFSGLELPTDMGRKVVTTCIQPGCYEVRVRAANSTEREEVAPLADMAARLQAKFEFDTDTELKKRGK